MLQRLRALTLLILALPGLILTPASGFVICLCDAEPSAQVTMGCCCAPPAGEAEDLSGTACDGSWRSAGCCGDHQDCGGCLEVELDEVLLASVDGSPSVFAPAVPSVMALASSALKPSSMRGGSWFIRPPPPKERPNAGLLPGVRPLRI